MIKSYRSCHYTRFCEMLLWHPFGVKGHQLICIFSKFNETHEETTVNADTSEHTSMQQAGFISQSNHIVRSDLNSNKDLYNGVADISQNRHFKTELGFGVTLHLLFLDRPFSPKSESQTGIEECHMWVISRGHGFALWEIVAGRECLCDLVLLHGY